MSQIIEQPRFSCALAAQQTVHAIPGALPIAHAGPGCISKTFAYLGEEAGNQGEGFGGGGQVACTNTSEKEVVFGGEDKLRALIKNSFKVLNADLFVVLAGCTSGIVGDDVVTVAKEFRDQGFPIVGVETSGFKGNNYYGHELVVNAIIDQFLPAEKVEVEKGLVNVFSVVPNQDPLWRGDLEEIKRILSLLGLKVNILFGKGSKGIEEWKSIPKAEYNLVISPWVGLSIAENLKKKYGTPYLHYPELPVGAKATSAFLKTVGETLKLDKSLVEKVIKEEEDRFYSYFLSVVDFTSDFRTNLPNEHYIVGDAAYTLGITNFLVNELGFTTKGIYIDDDPPTQQIQEKLISYGEKIQEGTGSLIHIESDGGLIQKHIRENLKGSKRAVIFGSTWEGLIANENKNLLIYISMPITDDVIITRSYVGYNGGLRLLEEIYSGMFKKVKITRSTQTL